VTVTATDSAGTRGTATFTWTITDLVTVANPGSQSSRLGAAVSLQINGNNPTAGLPPGLTMNEFTGLISGRPTQAGRYTVTVTASEQGADGGTISGLWWAQLGSNQ
jgi:hypothetical protein